jgi:hypothetical protein
MLKRGLTIAGLTSAKVGQGMPELKPVEARPLLSQPTGRASQVDEAGTIRPETGLETHDFGRGRMSQSDYKSEA